MIGRILELWDNVVIPTTLHTSMNAKLVCDTNQQKTADICSNLASADIPQQNLQEHINQEEVGIQEILQYQHQQIPLQECQELEMEENLVMRQSKKTTID